MSTMTPTPTVSVADMPDLVTTLDRRPPARGPYLAHSTLANGLRVAVRAQEPHDRVALAEGMAHLSRETRFRRFLAPKDTLTSRDLDRLVDRVDQHDHVAVVLVWPRTSQPDVVLGDARFSRLRGQPDTADVAVTVADEIQGQGAGRLLIHVLADLALDHGITHFEAVLLPSNRASARMLASVGTVVANRIESGTQTMTVALDTGNR
jgi:RimJ/RimL family protein N-acetyltransferase